MAVLSFTAAGNLALAVPTVKIRKIKDNTLITWKSKWHSNSESGHLFGFNQNISQFHVHFYYFYEEITNSLKISFLSRSTKVLYFIPAEVHPVSFVRHDKLIIRKTEKYVHHLFF